MTEPPKEKARDELIRVTEGEKGGRFVSLPPKQQSIEAVRFFVHEIYNPTRTPIAEDDLEEGVVDGANDLGGDFVYRDDNHVLIIQSKFRKPQAPEAPEEISHFQAVLQRLTNPETAVNRYLKEFIADIDWESDTFELIFISFGRIEGQARKISNQFPSYPKDIPGLADRCEWKFLDESDLNIELRNARNLQKGVSQKKIELFPLGTKGVRGASVIEVSAGDYRSFIMALDARQLIEAYNRNDKDALFSLNIRNYIGNSVTNKAIKDSAENDPENFFLYNNGISCLAAEVSVFENKLEVTGLQVINGAQTVTALVKLERDRRRSDTQIWLHNKKPYVLVRITEVPDNYGPSSKVREKITQYNNTQNTIKVSDFRSNDNVQSSLKEQFSKLHRNGKKVYYLPKRTDKRTPNGEIIRLEEFAKSVYAFLYDPTAFSGSTSFLFDTSKTGGYIKVFADGSHIWDKMPDDEFTLRAGIYWLSQELSGHLHATRGEEADPDTRASLERKWILLYATSIVFKSIYKNDAWRQQVRRLHKGDWTISDGHKGATVTKLFNVAKSAVTLAYKNSKANHVGFVHRNWMRSSKTPGEIGDLVRLIAANYPADIKEIPN